MKQPVGQFYYQKVASRSSKAKKYRAGYLKIWWKVSPFPGVLFFRNWFPRACFDLSANKSSVFCATRWLSWLDPNTSPASTITVLKSTELTQMLLKSMDPPQLALENQSAGWGFNGWKLFSHLQTQPTLADTAGVGLCTCSCKKRHRNGYWHLKNSPGDTFIP